MIKKICFIHTDTNGLHSYNGDVNKKKLFCFARLVKLSYDIGTFKNNQFHLEKSQQLISKPRCMSISEESIKYHGISQEYADQNGIDPENILLTFKNDIKNVNIIVSHSVNFHLKTIIAEAVKYNVSLDFNNYIIIDINSFYHSYGLLKLQDLAIKVKLKELKQSNIELIRDIFFKLYIKFEKSIKTS
jgi:DNA polymerase III epsilon subunit-like protein